MKNTCGTEVLNPTLHNPRVPAPLVSMPLALQHDIVPTVMKPTGKRIEEIYKGSLLASLLGTPFSLSRRHRLHG